MVTRSLRPQPKQVLGGQGVQDNTSVYYPRSKRTFSGSNRHAMDISWIFQVVGWRPHRINWRLRIFDRVKDAAFLPGAVPQQELESDVAAAAATDLETSLVAGVAKLTLPGARRVRRSPPSRWRLLQSRRLLAPDHVARWMRATDYTRTIDFAFQRWRVYRKVAHNTGAASAPVYRGDASRRKQISL